nr:Pvc16 family protein [Streptomyces sp. 769]
MVRTLHEIPVLPKELIEEAADRPYLAGSDLAASLQKVRFTPTQMDVDETSKLWGMLNNTPYALSVAYQASLVLLDGHQKPAPARPVKRPEVTVVPEVPPEVPLGTPAGTRPGTPSGTAGASRAGTAGSAGTGESAGATAGATAKAAEDTTATATTQDAARNAAKKPAKRTGGGRPQPTKTTATRGSSDAGRSGPRSRTRPRRTTDDGGES